MGRGEEAERRGRAEPVRRVTGEGSAFPTAAVKPSAPGAQV